MSKKLTFVLTSAVIIFLLFFSAANLQAEDNEVVLYYFWGDGCPVCYEQEQYLDYLEDKYPNLKVERFEVWRDEENREFFQEMLAAHEIPRDAVPQTFIGDQHWTGFRPQMLTGMEYAIQYCQEADCPDPLEKVPGHEKAVEHRRPDPLELPFIGEIELDQQPLWLATTLIAFVDGFNPCSLWVLTLLLALVIQTKSRSRVLIVGITFLIITASAYGAFIAGVYTAFDYIDQLFTIQLVVAALALLFGLVNIKDYFAYKKGISFTIPQRFQPKIYRGIRRLSNPRKSVPALIVTTAIMALGITLVELPCTAGFPVIWNGLLTLHGTGTTAFLFLLILYVFIYLLIELIIFLSAVFTLDATQMQQKHGEVLKLFGGTIMLALAGVLVYDPHLMNELAFTLYLFAGSVAVALFLVSIRKFFFSKPEAKSS